MYWGELSATPANREAASSFICSICIRATPPELGGGAVMAWKPRQFTTSGSRHTAR